MKEKIYSVKSENKEIEKLLNIENIYLYLENYLSQKIKNYDNFNFWLNKILEEAKEKDNFYRNIYLMISEENSEIKGVMILKSSTDENKICTLFVENKYRSNGLAKLFFEFAINNLKGDIVLTVSAENVSCLSSILVNFKFELLNIIKIKEKRFEYIFKRKVYG